MSAVKCSGLSSVFKPMSVDAENVLYYITSALFCGVTPCHIA